jgi:hypothetical protein
VSEKKAPFTRNKNSVADALIFESFAEAVARRASPDYAFSFVTSNKDDFSSKADHRLPHPDIAAVFDAPNVHYDNNIGDALNRLQPGTIPEQLVNEMGEPFDWTHPRCPDCALGVLSITEAEPSAFSGGWSYFAVCDHCGFRWYTGDLQ